MADVRALRSENVKLIIHIITLKVTQCKRPQINNITDRRMDKTYDGNTALCTHVHHAVKMLGKEP